MTSVTRNDWQAEVGPVVGRPTALVADDDPESRETLARILDGMGFTVFRAGAIAEAAAGAERYPGRLDLLVTGPELPDGSGPRLVRRLERLGFEPSVLYVTPRDRTDLLPAKASGSKVSVLPEPVSERAIAEEISVLFALDRGVAPPRSG